MKKFIICIFATCCFMLCMGIPTFAKETPVTISLDPYQNSYTNTQQTTVNDNLPQARWWPGDPNPQPGSQEWLWTHATMKPNTATKAKKCAINALLLGGFKGSAESAVVTWITKGIFTLGSFAATFGIGFAVDYFSCIL